MGFDCCIGVNSLMNKLIARYRVSRAMKDFAFKANVNQSSVRKILLSLELEVIRFQQKFNIKTEQGVLVLIALMGYCAIDRIYPVLFGYNNELKDEEVEGNNQALDAYVDARMALIEPIEKWMNFKADQVSVKGFLRLSGLLSDFEVLNLYSLFFDERKFNLVPYFRAILSFGNNMDFIKVPYLEHPPRSPFRNPHTSEDLLNTLEINFDDQIFDPIIDEKNTKIMIEDLKSLFEYPGKIDMVNIKYYRD